MPVLIIFLFPLLLVACGPSEKLQAVLAEKNRIECLDKFCPGDIEPPYDRDKDVALKLNGKWYVGPKEYFCTRAGAVFYWPSKTPKIGLPNGQCGPEKGLQFNDGAVEIFLRSKDISTDAQKSVYQALVAERDKGHVIQRNNIRPGFDFFKTRFKKMEESWYIATDLRYPNGDPPTISCRVDALGNSRCSGWLLWNPDVRVGLRFSTAHALDWPEIYIEINRVLQQLRKV